MNQFAKSLALGIALAAASPMAYADTVTIGFTGGVDGAPLPYSADGYTLTSSAGWTIENGGDPKPALFDIITDDNSPQSFDISSNSGGTFLFDSLDIATGNKSEITYTITGYSASSAEEWTTGAVGLIGVTAQGAPCPSNYTPGTGYLCFLQIDAPANELSASYVDVSISAGLVDPQVYVDNITLTSTPEPGSLLLLGTGLAGACGVISRKRRAAVA